MTGEVLRIALGRTKRPVLVLDGETVIQQVSAAAALEIVRDAPYKGSGTKHRVTAIYRYTPQEPEPPAIWQPCWRNTKGPVLPVSIEWLRSVGA